MPLKVFCKPAEHRSIIVLGLDPSQKEVLLIEDRAGVRNK